MDQDMNRIDEIIAGMDAHNVEEVRLMCKDSDNTSLYEEAENIVLKYAKDPNDVDHVIERICSSYR